MGFAVADLSRVAIRVVDGGFALCPLTVEVDEQRTAAGQTVAYLHDEEGRLLSVIDPFGNAVER